MSEAEGDSEQIVRTDRELLLLVKKEVSFLRKELKEREQMRQEQMKESVLSPIKDHETRIRVLENFRWWILGAIGVSNFAAALYGKFMK